MNTRTFLVGEAIHHLVSDDKARLWQIYYGGGGGLRRSNDYNAGDYNPFQPSDTIFVSFNKMVQAKVGIKIKYAKQVAGLIIKCEHNTHGFLAFQVNKLTPENIALLESVETERQLVEALGLEWVDGEEE